MSAFIVGLTGGIGSGKSTIAKLFSKLNIDVIDADKIARETVDKGTPALAKITDYFGHEILTTNGELDRAKLRTLVFSQPEKKEWLNNLLHPLIRQQLFDKAKSARSPYCILEVPLLIENGLYKFVDSVLVVDVTEKVQLARASKRDKTSIEGIKQIIKSQATREQRLALANQVIDNNLTDLTAIEKRVNELHQLYLSANNHKFNEKFVNSAIFPSKQ